MIGPLYNFTRNNWVKLQVLTEELRDKLRLFKDIVQTEYPEEEVELNDLKIKMSNWIIKYIVN